MKTTGLDFISAVKAVKDGLCEKVYSRLADRYIYKEDENEIEQAVCRFATILATDYELINPRVPMEDVEVKRWLCTTCNSVFVYPSALVCDCNRSVFPLVQLTGTYQRPVKEMVKRRIEIKESEWSLCTNTRLVYPSGGIGADYSQFIGKTGTLTFEWEEEA